MDHSERQRAGSASVVALSALAVAGLLVIGFLAISDRTSAADAVMHKSPACACCDEYRLYLERNGVGVAVERHADMAPVKERYGVGPGLQSCHTLVMNGYVIEGHVPYAAVARLMEDRPDVLGISLPGMPAGSPGMGGDQAAPFVVYAFDADGVREYGRF